MSWIAACAATAACALMAAAPAGADAAASENGRLLIVEAPHHTDPGGTWIVNPDGSGRKAVPGPDISLKWSPDGGEVAFLCRSGLCRSLPNGARKRVVVRPGGVTAFSWARDGKRFALLAANGRDVLLVAATGGKPALLTRLRGLRASSVHWSPDGEQLALVKNIGADGVYTAGWVCVLRAERGARPRCLARTGAAGNVSDPSWSNDSRSFVFSRSTAETADATSWIYLVDVRSQSVKRLHKGGRPQMSPVTREMAYGNDQGVYVRGLTSGTPRQIARSGYMHTWAPNGEALAYATGGGIAVAPAHGGDGKLVFRESFNDLYSISWGRAVRR